MLTALLWGVALLLGGYVSACLAMAAIDNLLRRSEAELRAMRHTVLKRIDEPYALALLHRIDAQRIQAARVRGHLEALRDVLPWWWQ